MRAQHRLAEPLNRGIGGYHLIRYEEGGVAHLNLANLQLGQDAQLHISFVEARNDDRVGHDLHTQPLGGGA